MKHAEISEAELNAQFATLLAARENDRGLFNLDWRDDMRTEGHYNNAYADHDSSRNNCP